MEASSPLGYIIAAVATIIAGFLAYLGVRYTALKAAETNLRASEIAAQTARDAATATKDANAVAGFDALTGRLEERLARTEKHSADQDRALAAHEQEMSKLRRLFEAAMTFIAALVAQYPKGKVLPAAPLVLAEYMAAQNAKSGSPPGSMEPSTTPPQEAT